MRQAIHIFRKDVRALWPQILLVLALTALAPLPNTENVMLTWALVIARWYLIVCAVHQEKLVGDRQFWVTRPYGWKNLLAAKALFFAVFVQLPVLVTDVAILVSQGLPLGPAWGNLFMRQAGLVLVWQYGLPAMALAAVTQGLVGFALAALGTMAALYGLFSWLDSGAIRWDFLLWIPLISGMIVLGLASAATLVWQYRRRRTLAARTVLCGAMAVCATLLTLPPTGLAVGLHTRILRAPGEVRNIGVQFANEISIARANEDNPQGTLDLGVRLDGIPEGMRVDPDLFSFQIRTQDGTQWSSGWQPVGNTWEWAPGAKVSIAVPPAVLERLRFRDVEMRLSLLLTVLGPERTQWVNLRHGSVVVDGVGICSLGDQAIRAVNCRNSVPPEANISVPIGGYSFTRALAWPFRVSMGASPVWRTTVPLAKYWNGEVAFKLRKPVAHLRRELVMEKVRLANYW